MITPMITPMVSSMVTNMVSGLVDEITLLDIDNIIVFGASNMQNTWGASETAFAVEEFATYGINVTVNARGVSGDTTSEMKVRLPAILTEFSAVADTTLFICEWSGNDITGGTGWPDREDLIRDNCTSMLQDMIAAGFKVAPSTSIFRQPPHDPSLPYNTGIHDALIAEYANAPLDMYTFSEVNQVDFFGATGGDGIHCVAAFRPEFRDYTISTIAPFIVRDNPTVTEPTDVLIQFGEQNVFPEGYNEIKATLRLPIVHNIGGEIIEGASITVDALNGLQLNDTGGVGNVNDPTNTTLTIENNAGLESVMFSGGDAFLDFSRMGFIPTANYKVEMVGSRTLSGRTTIFTIGSETIETTSNASPVEVATFASVTGADLLLGMTCVQGVGSFIYLSLMRIQKL